MSATAVSGDGTTLLVQDGTLIQPRLKLLSINIASGTFTSLGFLGSTNHQTYATAINSNGTVVAGYSSLDNGNHSGFIWNASNGVTVLAIPTNHPNTVYLEPTCMSDDGTTMYGRLTEGGGWVGFRYNTTTGYQDLGNPLSPAPARRTGRRWSGSKICISRRSGRLATAAVIWTIWSPPTSHRRLSPRWGSSILRIQSPFRLTARPSRHCGPDAYLADQIWYGVWQIFLPVSAEDGGDSNGHAELHDGLPDDLERAGWNADSICRIQHRRVRSPRQRAALCLRIHAERGRLIQLYAQTGLYQRWH